MPTRHNANVVIENKTGKKLVAVSVVHKYSDEYVDHLSWKKVGNKQVTSSQSVSYNTGAFTTGRDWWVVSWIDETGKLRYTDPNNLRGLFDFLENMILNINTDPSPFDSTWDEAYRSFIAGIQNSGLLNKESTSGFKQHILRTEDAGKTTTIVLTDTEVTFISQSGKSSTGVKKSG